MFGVVSVHSLCALASGKCRKRHHVDMDEDEEEDEEEVEDEEEYEMKAQKGMGHLLRELYDLGFVIPFATACGMLVRGLAHRGVPRAHTQLLAHGRLALDALACASVLGQGAGIKPWLWATKSSPWSLVWRRRGFIRCG